MNGEACKMKLDASKLGISKLKKKKKGRKMNCKTKRTSTEAPARQEQIKKQHSIQKAGKSP